MPDLFVAPETNQEQAVGNKPQPIGQIQSSAVETLQPNIHNAGIFSTYCKNPGNISFGTQEPSEQILLFLRRDFITNVPWILSSLLLTIAPTLLSVITSWTNIQTIVLTGN